MPVHVDENPLYEQPNDKLKTHNSGPLSMQQKQCVAEADGNSTLHSLPQARWYGVYPAIVEDNLDPEGIGRVKVRLTWAPDGGGIVGIEKEQRYEGWARMAMLMAGNDRGSWFLPDIGDEVLISFEGGHAGRPVVMGMLWNGQDRPPESMDSERSNDVKVLRMKSGSEIRFEGENGKEKIQLKTPSGQKIMLTDDAGGMIHISDNNGNTLKLDSTGISFHSLATVKIQASQIQMSAGSVNIDAGMAKFSGVVKCDSLIANSVVANSYTPGAGNIL
jgi:uncharacterized protein involved in type VI secretion and phage assembly